MNKIKEKKFIPIGMIMSIADLVPGISGATVAVLLGYYDRLLRVIHRAPLLFFYIKKYGFKYAFIRLDYKFVVCLGTGLATGIVVFSKIIHFLLTNYPTFLFSCFGGLILGGAWLLLRQNWVKTNTKDLILNIVSLSVGVVLGYLVMDVMEISLPDNNIGLMIAGFLGFSAMIIPGISGSFVLLISGMYERIIYAVSHFIIEDLVVFLIGGAIGLLVFSNLMYYVLRYFRHKTFIGLSGFVFYSVINLFNNEKINKVDFTILSINDIIIMASLFVVGFLFVFGLEKISNDKK